MQRFDVQQVIDQYQLEPLEGEGGYFKRIHTCHDDQGNPLAGVIWYLMVPNSFSSLHWLPTDEIWYHLQGDPIDQLVLKEDGTWSRTRLGKDDELMTVVPGRCWQGTKLAELDEPKFGYALCSTVMAPAYDPATYRQGSIDLLLEYPSCSLLREYL